MKRFAKSFVALMLVFMTLVSCLPLTVLAAKETLYETVKDKVPIWSEPTSKSTKLRVVEDEGSFLSVVSSTTNKYGNVFYKLSDGSYVFKDNVKKHKCASAMCSVEKKSYEYIDQQTHKRIGKMDELCLCKAVLDTSTTIKYEQHSFGSNNLCACGYAKPEIHIHTYKNGVCGCGAVEPHTHAAVACGEEAISYSPKDAATHTVLRTIPHLCSCGLELGKEQKTGAEGHSFSITGKCRQCGYQKHICKASSGGNESVSYEQSSEETHIKVTRTTDVVCNCGAVVKKSTVTLKAEDHSFNSKGVCKDCGYQKHVCEPASQPQTKTRYEKSSPDLHLRIDETAATMCSCGVTLTPAKQSKQVEQHSFSNGKCIYCGYITPKETHTHKGITCGESFFIYSQKNSDLHIKTEKVPSVCSCGATVSFSSLDTEEKHTFKDRICQDCGFKQGTGLYDTDPIQMAEQAVLGNYADSVTISGIVTEVIVGEIPVVGTIADIRDVIADFQQDAGFVPTIIDAAALIPFVGALKYTDEAADAIKGVSKVDDVVDGKSLGYLRQKAVNDAWKLEYDNVVQGGTGISRVWTEDQILELKSTGKVKGFDGHHIKSVSAYPKLAGSGSNIQFLTRAEHFRAHSGNWKSVTNKYFDYNKAA